MRSTPVLDQLFFLYYVLPQYGIKFEAMTIGIHKFRTPKEVAWLPGILSLPFKGKITEYAINTRRWGKQDER